MRLLPELRQNKHRIRLESIHMRVIDNATISLSAAELWCNNYHLIHLLDFLPAALWQLQANDIPLMNGGARLPVRHG